MTYVLLTRPDEDCRELKSKLLVPAICSPLLKVEQSVHKVTPPKGTTDLIVTSARVFEMVKNIKDMTKIPVWCVGEATAAAAKEVGFETIFQVNRSAQEILERIIKECQKDSSRFVHICGSVVHVDLADALTKLGYHADRIVIYTTEAATKLTPEAEAIMAAGLVQQMPFFSLRSAEVFIDIARTSDWAENLSKITALAHSENIAQTLKQLSWRRVVVVPDLSAERIQEHYIRPGDSPMKPTNLLVNAILTISVAAIVSFLGYLISSDTKHSPQPIDLKPIQNQIKELKTGLDKTNSWGTQIQEIQTKITEIEEKISQPSTLPAPNKSESTPHQVDTPLDTSLVPSSLTDKTILSSLRNQIIKGIVLTETIETANTHLSSENRVPLTLISIRDLKDKLSQLSDLHEETSIDTSSTLGDKAKNILGLKIRQTKPSTLKDQLQKSLDQENFDFITDLEKKSLPQDWAQWLILCKETAHTLRLLDKKLEETGE